MERTYMVSEMVESLVSIPKWVERPNRVQRHWIRYAIISIMSLSFLKFLYKHSPLSGSEDMYKWAQGVKFALETHVAEPLRNLTEEVFDTFHGYRSPHPR